MQLGGASLTIRCYEWAVAIDELLADLNPQQRAAATHDDRPLLIVAGAGTGKTATLVHRVAWLISRGSTQAAFCC